MEAVRDDAVMAEINITPFTDVLLVLLIIFMILAAIVAPPGFEKKLGDPGRANPPRRVAAPTIEVVVNENGRIFVDGKPSDERALYRDLLATVQHRGKLHVALAADVKAPYSAIIRILDAAKVAGLESVGFVTS
ncbi:MAG TPA: biopolymer transporter ExbD [Candidatus Elarobacter sp.]|jgi:biopolymer transport protein ExbD